METLGDRVNITTNLILKFKKKDKWGEGQAAVLEPFPCSSLRVLVLVAPAACPSIWFGRLEDSAKLVLGLLDWNQAN